MRAYVKLALVISNDNGQDDTVFDNRKKPLTIDDVSPGPAQGDGRTVIIPANGLYVRVSLGGVVPNWLYIESDTDITVRLNSVDGLSGTEIPVTPIVQTVPAPTPGQVLPPQNGGLFLRGQLGAFDVWIRNSTSGGTATPASVKVAFAG